MELNPQERIWNGTVGHAWSTHADHFDAMLEPFSDALFQRLDVRDDDRALDVGCGTGSTTIRLAELAASAVGIDLSAPMLAAARNRAAIARIANAEFRTCDVEMAPFAAAEFDVALSRFGVMFFTDPVRAFGHIRMGLVARGRLGFVCYGTPMDNPFILVPVMAAAAHLPLPPPPGPTAPSPFSLADPERTTGILTAAGFADVAIVAGPASVTLGPADDIESVARRVLEQNPGVAPALAAASPTEQQRAIAATVDALADHVSDGAITLAASSWIVTATAP